MGGPTRRPLTIASDAQTSAESVSAAFLVIDVEDGKRWGGFWIFDSSETAALGYPGFPAADERGIRSPRRKLRQVLSRISRMASTVRRDLHTAMLFTGSIAPRPYTPLRRAAREANRWIGHSVEIKTVVRICAIGSQLAWRSL